MLKVRVMTALVMLLALSGVIFLLPAPAVAAAFGLIAALAAWEWAGLMGIDRPGRILFGVVVVVFCVQTFFLGESGFVLFWLAAALFWLLPAVLWLRYRWTMVGNDFLGYALGLVLIVAAWAALVALHARGPWVLIAIMAIAWVADIAAYFAGRAFGRHKLAPAISPGKTWEGVGGAVIAVVLYGLALATTGNLLADVSAKRLLGVGLFLMLLTAISVIGDLFESLVKRQAGVKDSSGLLPGHGGILDRIDSLLALLPVAALVLYWSGK